MCTADIFFDSDQMLITGKEKMSIAMVVRAKKMAADLREKHEKVRKSTLCSASLKMTAITKGRERREKGEIRPLWRRDSIQFLTL
jgi:hypothetical protein